MADVLRDAGADHAAERARPDGAASPRCRRCCARRESAKRLRALDMRRPARAAGAVRDVGRRLLDGWFESDPIKAVLGFDGIVGNYASPYTPGSAYVLLHHVLRRGERQEAASGATPSAAWARSPRRWRAPAPSAGVEIRTDCAVHEVLVERGRAAGVVTDERRAIAAARWSPTSIRSSLFERLRRSGDPAGRISRPHRRYRSGSGTFRMNLALAELPDFTALPGQRRPSITRRGIIIAPSLAYMERAYFDARRAGWSRRADHRDADPLDPRRHARAARAARGQPVLPACRAEARRTGAHGTKQRETVADLMIDTVEAYAPGFKASVIARHDPDAPRPRARLRPRRRRHFSREPRPRPALFGEARARSRRLPFAAQRLVHVRRLDPSRRRRHRRAGPQCRARDDPRFSRKAVGRPWIGVIHFAALRTQSIGEQIIRSSGWMAAVRRH